MHLDSFLICPGFNSTSEKTRHGIVFIWRVGVCIEGDPADLTWGANLRRGTRPATSANKHPNHNKHPYLQPCPTSPTFSPQQNPTTSPSAAKANQTATPRTTRTSRGRCEPTTSSRRVRSRTGLGGVHRPRSHSAAPPVERAEGLQTSTRLSATSGTTPGNRASSSRTTPQPVHGSARSTSNARTCFPMRAPHCHSSNSSRKLPVRRRP